MLQNQGSLITHSAIQTLVESGLCPGSKTVQLSLPASLQGASLKDWQARQDMGKQRESRASCDLDSTVLLFGVHSGMALLCHSSGKHQKWTLKVRYA